MSIVIYTTQTTSNTSHTGKNLSGGKQAMHSGLQYRTNFIARILNARIE